MERQDLIERLANPSKGTVDYIRTDRALELYPIMVALGEWAQRNVDPEIALCDRDARTLAWYIRRKIDMQQLPKTRTVIRFHFTDASAEENTFWLVAKPEAPVELCLSDPGFAVDLFVDTEMPILTGVLLGRCSLREAVRKEDIRFCGAPLLSRTVGWWLTLSQFADTPGTLRSGNASSNA